MSVKITTKHASYSLVTFVTHKRFAVPFFLPSCCVNSLITVNNGPTRVFAHPDDHASRTYEMTPGFIIVSKNEDYVVTAK